MQQRVEHYLNQMEVKAEPADLETIATAEALLGTSFPAELVELYELHDGLDGWVSDDPEDEDSGGVLILYPVSELAETNAAYEFPGQTPGFVLIGSDGGGEAYVLDYRNDPPSYVVVPFIGRDFNVALPAGDSLAEFFTAVAENAYSVQRSNAATTEANNTTSGG